MNAITTKMEKAKEGKIRKWKKYYEESINQFNATASIGKEYFKELKIIQ